MKKLILILSLIIFSLFLFSYAYETLGETELPEGYTTLSKDITTGETTYSYPDGSYILINRDGQIIHRPEAKTDKITEGDRNNEGVPTTYTVYGEKFNSETEAQKYLDSLNHATPGDGITLNIGGESVDLVLGDNGMWKDEGGMIQYTTEGLNKEIQSGENPGLMPYTTTVSFQTDNRYQTRTETVYYPKTGNPTGEEQLIVTDNKQGTIDAYTCQGDNCKLHEGSSNYKKDATNTIIKKTDINNKAYITATLNEITSAMGIMMEGGNAFGVLHRWISGDKADEIWLDDFQQKYGKYMGIDAYISQELCKMPTDSDQLSTSIFFSNGDVGMTIEGYKMLYNSAVYCTNSTECKELFKDDNVRCSQNYCSGSDGKRKLFNQNVYKVSLLASPSSRVLKEGKMMSFYIRLGRTKTMDINHDGRTNSSDMVTLMRGGNTYTLFTSDFSATSIDYADVCIELQNDASDIFTSEFYTLWTQVASGQRIFCNSFVAEGAKTQGETSLLGLNANTLLKTFGFNQYSMPDGLNG